MRWIVHLADVAQNNPYGYAGGCPSTYTDPSGESFITVIHCIGAVGALVAGNLFAVAKVRKAGGVIRFAKRLTEIRNWEGRYKALLAFFGELTGIAEVASSCG